MSHAAGADSAGAQSMATPKKPLDRDPGGRPTKYDPKYCQLVVDWFTNADRPKIEIDSNGKPFVIPAIFPTLERFAHSIGVSHTTLNEWAQVHQEFSAAKKKAHELQQSWLIESGLLGASNPTMSIFVLKCCHGFREAAASDPGQTAAPTTLTVVDASDDANTQ